MYIIKYPGPRNTCKIQKLGDCQTRSSSFSKKEIEKLYRKNHIIINYSEAVNRDNISQVIYCKGELIICWRSVLWFCGTALAIFTLTYFQSWPTHFLKTIPSHVKRLPPPPNFLLSVQLGVSFGCLHWKQAGKRQHPWSRPWNNLAVYIAISSWGLAYSSWRTGFVPMSLNITIYFHARNSNQ